eukprot:Seg7765.2 transcript_id=Seg7765.2/GoldUCD/mRNA.D3Y31 product="hypothetical protein" protein_id=Seg7765.2/GoldUCD/D3Y31
MQYRVTDVCLPIFNINGTMRKAVKAKLCECFTFKEAKASHSPKIALVDMGLLWRLAMPSKEDREKVYGSAFTWGDYASKLLDMVIQRHPHASSYHLVNDRYDIQMTIKDCEHVKRSSVYAGEIPEYTCYHHEADTRLFFHASILDRKTVASRISVDSEDTDVVPIAAKVAHKISKELCLYRKGHNYDCKSLCSPEVVSAVLPLHALTGADVVSGFYGHSKKTVFNGMVKNGQQSPQLISDLGREYSVTEEVPPIDLRSWKRIFSHRGSLKASRAVNNPNNL